MTALLMLSNVGLGCMVGMAPRCSLTLSKVKLIVVVCFETRCSNLLWRNRLVTCCLWRTCCRYGVMVVSLYRITRTVEQSKSIDKSVLVNCEPIAPIA